MAMKGIGILEKWIKSSREERLQDRHFEWVKSLPYPVAVCDRLGKILSMNDSFVELTGQGRDELELQRIYWFLPKRQGEEIRKELEVLREQSSITQEINIGLTGEEQLMEVTVIPIEEDETVRGQFWIFSDQSEKKRLQDELRRLKKQSHPINNTVEIGTWTYDFERKEFFASRDTYQIFGRTPEQFDGSLSNVLQFLQRKHRRNFEEAMNRAHEGTPLDITFQIITGEGQEKDIHARAEMFYQKDGSPDKMIGTVQDITHSMGVEKSLASLEQKLPKEEGLNEKKCYRVDLTEGKVHLGKDIREIYGYDRDDEKHNRSELLDRIHSEDRKKIQNMIENLKEGDRYEIEYRIIGTKGDAYRFVRSKGTGEFQKGKLAALVGTIEDLTDIHFLQNDIKKTYRELQEAQRSFRMGVWSMDLTTYQLSWSKVTFEIYGLDPERGEPAFEDFVAMIHPEDQKNVHQAIKEPPKNQPFEVEFRIIPPNKKTRHVKHLVELVYQDQKPMMIRGNIQDVTDQKELQEKAMNTQEKYENLQNRYQMILDNSEEILEIIDEQGFVKYINPGVIRLTGHHQKEVVGKSIWDFVEGSEKEKLKNLVQMSRNKPRKILRGTVKCFTKDRREIYLEVTMNNHLNDPEVQGIILNWKDTTAKINLQKKINHIANFDETTGLPNQAFFRQNISEEVRYAMTNGYGLALFMIDIDEFKQINNALGTEAGDQLIKKIAEKLQLRYPKDRGFLARYFGDQFALLLRDVDGPKQGQKIAKEILDIFDKPFSVEQYDLNVHISLGFSTYPEDGRQAEELIKNGNTALLGAKEDGKNRYRAYSSNMDIISFKNFSLRNDLARAIEEEQLRLHFQPIINLHNGKILGLEALIRWEHPEWGMVSPAEFIPIAESTGLIIPIGRWVLEQVCINYQRWMDKGYPAVKMSVNCSVIEFFQRDFVRNIQSTLEKYKLDPSFLILELTESVLIEQRQQTAKDLKNLQSMGIQIAIDDFGSGYSSLTYLNEMDLDILKIDQEFLKTVPDKISSNKILEAVVNLAKELKMKIVAEGIENWDQLIFLRRLNCISGQGYLYSKPLPPEKLERMLSRGWIRPAKANDAKMQMKNDRRKYFRVDFHRDLEADMTILEISGKKIKVGNTKALIKNMGPGGLCFISNINFPIKKDLILQFNTELLGETIRVYGTTVWKQELEQGIVKYGLKFTFDENARMELTGILNKAQVRMRKDYGFNEGRFTSKSLKAFFHNQQSENLEEGIEENPEW